MTALCVGRANEHSQLSRCKQGLCLPRSAHSVALYVERAQDVGGEHRLARGRALGGQWPIPCVSSASRIARPGLEEPATWNRHGHRLSQGAAWRDRACALPSIQTAQQNRLRGRAAGAGISQPSVISVVSSTPPHARLDHTPCVHPTRLPKAEGQACGCSPEGWAGLQTSSLPAIRGSPAPQPARPGLCSARQSVDHPRNDGITQTEPRTPTAGGSAAEGSLWRWLVLSGAAVGLPLLRMMQGCRTMRSVTVLGRCRRWCGVQPAGAADGPRDICVPTSFL